MIRISALRRTGLVLAALPAAQPALAQDKTKPAMPPAPPSAFAVSPPTIANPQPDHPAYADVIAAIESAVDQDVVLNNALAAVKRQMLADPNLAMAEQMSPGLVDEIIAGMRPVIDRHNARVTAAYRPRMTAISADYLTPEEAVTVAAFYRSDIGRKLMGGVTADLDFDQSIAAAIKDQTVKDADVQADIMSAVGKGLQSMDASDLAAMMKMTQENPALLKLSQIAGPMQRLRTQMENEPLLPEDDAEILKVVEAVFAKRFPE